jgi:hypothetical protein
LTAVAAFGSFLIAQHFGASGVLATVAAGMTMGNLGVLGEKEHQGLPQRARCPAGQSEERRAAGPDRAFEAKIAAG